MTKEELQEHSELSRIALSEEETEMMLKKITDVERYVNMLNTPEMTGVAPTIYLEDDPMTLREDIPQESETKKDTLMNAPQEDYGYFALENMME